LFFYKKEKVFTILKVACLTCLYKEVNRTEPSPSEYPVVCNIKYDDRK